MYVLIFGNHTQGLGIIRSLQETQVRKLLVNDKLISLARFSKYLDRYCQINRGTLGHIYLPYNQQILIGFIEHFVAPRSQCVSFAVHDDLIYFLQQNRERLRSRILFPANEIGSIIDKYLFSKHVEQLGMPTPRTYLMNEFKENFLKEDRSFVAKGRLGNRFRNISNLKGKLIKSKKDFKNLQNYVCERIDQNKVIVQEIVQNNHKVYSCCGFAIKGEILRSFQYVKFRQHPDQFGTGTFLKSIRNEELFEQTVSIIGCFHYTGIFEVEFIQNDNRAFSVIEFNPRTWKSIHFATCCGQNLCQYYYDYMKFGKRPSTNHKYDVNRTWVDLATDIPVLLKSRSIRHAGSDRNTFFCVLNRKDPLPFIMEILLAPFLAMGI